MSRDRRGMNRSQAEALVGTAMVVLLGVVIVVCCGVAVWASGGLW